MSIRNTLLYAGVLLGTVSMSAIMPAIAYADGKVIYADADIVVTTAPPPAKVEVVPAPRKGYIWSPGYWKWENNEHMWVEGRWLEERPSEHWIPDQWNQDPDQPNHWHFRPGHWEAS